MSSKQPESLSSRLAFTIAASSLLIIIAASFVLYRISFEEQVRQTESTLDQLVNTVRTASAIAAYVGDTELAKEVVDGLTSNDIVDGALLITSQKVLYSAGDAAEGGFSRRFNLISPFDESEKVGELVISPNRELIKQSAAASARRLVFTMIIYTLIILGILVSLVNWQFTRPIKKLANQLHRVLPGSDDRLACPDMHRDNEIGRLVTDTNQLLESVQHTLAQERNLRQVVDQLQKKFRLIFESASSGIALIDYEGRVQVCNASFAKLFGSRYLGNGDNTEPLSLAYSFRDVDHFHDIMMQVKADSLPVEADLEVNAEQGQATKWFHCLISKVANEEIGSFLELVVYDVSERANRERQIQKAAEHDPLTQLYNRRAGEQFMQDALDAAGQNRSQCALMMIDLDRFKPINDLHGHDAGDMVLIEVAQRLINCVRGEDLVIRWGGDEFVVFLKSEKGVINSVPVAEKILRHITQPIIIDDDTEVTIGASIGIALYPQHSDQLVYLIELADDNMYQIKKDGRNDFRIAS
jgi:diguanylate cyclase (GGDEF)-like protein